MFGSKAWTSGGTCVDLAGPLLHLGHQLGNSMFHFWGSIGTHWPRKWPKSSMSFATQCLAPSSASEPRENHVPVIHWVYAVCSWNNASLEFFESPEHFVPHDTMQDILVPDSTMIVPAKCPKSPIVLPRVQNILDRIDFPEEGLVDTIFHLKPNRRRARLDSGILERRKDKAAHGTALYSEM